MTGRPICQVNKQTTAGIRLLGAAPASRAASKIRHSEGSGMVVAIKRRVMRWLWGENRPWWRCAVWMVMVVENRRIRGGGRRKFALNDTGNGWWRGITFGFGASGGSIASNPNYPIV